MKMEKNFYNYFFLASLASLVDIGLLYAFTDILGIFYLLSATLSFVAAQVLNYYMNKTLNFGDKNKKMKRQMLIFISVNTFGLAISLVILAVLVEMYGVWYILAKIISMLVAVNFNYYMHKNYTFA